MDLKVLGLQLQIIEDKDAKNYNPEKCYDKCVRTIVVSCLPIVISAEYVMNWDLGPFGQYDKIFITITHGNSRWALQVNFLELKRPLNEYDFDLNLLIPVFGHQSAETLKLLIDNKAYEEINR